MESTIAAERFGLGARPGELREIDRDPRGWLLDQLELPDPAAPALSDSASLLAELGRLRSGGEDGKEELRRRQREIHEGESAARMRWLATTDRPFLARWVTFWSNHFTVSVERHEVLGVAGSFEREVTAAHALGRFEDLLLASTRHPAMLLYLDNVQSTGPHSPVGRRTGQGLNENLAREILELHTLGVNGGYGQADVEALARLLTGWTLLRGDVISGTTFDPDRHEPGTVVLMGYSYPGLGEVDGEAALRDLARHPSTATFVATKLCRHFLADDPSEDAVAALSKTFRDSRGDLQELAKTLVALPHAWSLPLTKLKTPVELVVSTARALEMGENGDATARSLRFLGQPPFQAPSPKGWDDVEEAWLAPEALMLRLEWTQRVAREARAGDAIARAEDVLGPRLTGATRDAIAAHPGSEGVALMLASPEFQRR